MKEILKYLRNVNLYSQETVAEAIGLSRQSYNKYEAGTVIPSDKIINKLADLYRVTPEFIKSNQIPKLPCKNKYEYKDSGTVSVASAEPAYCVKTLEVPVQTYKAIYHHGNLILEDTDVDFIEGQELLIVIKESTEEELARKEKAWQVIEDAMGKFKLPTELKDLSYEEIRDKALEEKYGPF